MFNEMISMSEMMNKIAGYSASEQNNLSNVWKTVVSKIKTNKDSEACETRVPIGERLAGNTRVIDLKNGILLIETDHSGWIQYLKIYEKFIIKGLKMALPDLKINTLAFRMSGSNVGFSVSYEESLTKAQQNFNKKLEEQEEELEKLNLEKKESKNQNEGSKLPQELLDKFDSIRQSINERE